jgi:hypothetical protein
MQCFAVPWKRFFELLPAIDGESSKKAAAEQQLGARSLVSFLPISCPFLCVSGEQTTHSICNLFIPAVSFLFSFLSFTYNATEKEKRALQENH